MRLACPLVNGWKPSVIPWGDAVWVLGESFPNRTVLPKNETKNGKEASMVPGV